MRALGRILCIGGASAIVGTLIAALLIELFAIFVPIRLLYTKESFSFLDVVRATVLLTPITFVLCGWFAFITGSGLAAWPLRYPPVYTHPAKLWSKAIGIGLVLAIPFPFVRAAFGPLQNFYYTLSGVVSIIVCSAAVYVWLRSVRR
jgi:hypothetical protein